jgi:hypothetical protein
MKDAREIRNAYESMAGKPQGKEPLVRYSYGGEYNIKLILQKNGVNFGNT